MSGLDLWLGPEAVAELPGAESKRAVLAALAEVAGRALGAPAAGVLERLLAREAQGSTGVGQGVALPHAALPGLTAMRAVFLRLRTPAPFAAVDDEPVDLVLALFAPEAAAGRERAPAVEHLRALAAVSRRLRDRNLRASLRLARSPEALYALLTRQAAAAA